MKASQAACSVAILLLLATCFLGAFAAAAQLQDEAHERLRDEGKEAHDEASEDTFQAFHCCTSHSMRSFPKRIVKSYYYTSSHCRLRSVVFVFVNGRTACADLETRWVQELIKYLDSLHNPSF